MSFKDLKLIQNIDTVQGICEHCREDTILIAIVSEFYRCTSCGEDTKQHINGEIKYLKLTEDGRQWLKNQSME